MGIDQKIINEIIKRILKIAQPERIILFGSAATGEMTSDSDIDLLILQDSASNKEKDWLSIDQALRGMTFPFDIIIMPVEQFEESKNVIGGIAYPAHKDGKVIYEAA